jgi:hypothetical protein
MYFFDPAAGIYTPAGNRGTDPYSVNGAAVMYAPGKILKIGGAQAYTNNSDVNLTGVNATNSAYLIDISQDYANPAAMPTVTQLAPMNFPRAYANAVVLPDGEVFVVGGQTQPLEFTDVDAVMTPEIWNPATMQFTELAAMPTPRDYHSTALLMPDGRIWVGGGGDLDNIDFLSGNHPDFEIYTPPYLYAPDGSLAVRPVITSAPASLTLGNALTVSGSANVTSFDLVRMGTATHTLDTDQRRVPLTIQSAANGTYTLAVPSDPGITVPGYWMLFALDAKGVPSVSAIIHIAPATTANAPAIAEDPTRTVTGTGPHSAVAFHGPESEYTINYTGNDTATVTDSVPSRDGTVISINNEMLQFSDQPYFIESGDNANIARLYSAGLGRIPDPAGLFGWEDYYANNVSATDKAQGVYVSLAETSGGFNGDLSIADGFIFSPEFNAKYGTLSDADFVTQLYQNVLGRGPDPDGLNGWLNFMTQDGFTRAMVLVGFAESAENITKTSSWMTDISRSG